MIMSSKLCNFFVSNGVAPSKEFIEYLKKDNIPGVMELHSLDGKKYNVSYKDGTLIAVNIDDECNFYRIPADKSDVCNFIDLFNSTDYIVEQAFKTFNTIIEKRLTEGQIKFLAEDLPDGIRVPVLLATSLIALDYAVKYRNSKSMLEKFASVVSLNVSKSCIDLVKQLEK